MHRVVVEIVIVAVAAVVMAALVLTIGSAIEPPVEPIVLVPGGAELRSSSAMTCFDAPLTVAFAQEPGGYASLCQADRTLHLAIRAAGLVPGETYVVWLGYPHELAACQSPTCASGELSYERSTGLMQQVIGEPGALTRALAFDTTIRDVQLAPGTEVTLLLLRVSGQMEAQATFSIRVPPAASVSTWQTPLS